MSFLDKLFPRASAEPTVAASALTTGVIPFGREEARSPELRVEGGIASDRGCVRETNEVFARVIRPTTGVDLAHRGLLAVVCDGMGGHEGGEIASRLAVETIVQRFETDVGDPLAMLPRALQSANRTIFEASLRNAKLKGMGTTCTALVLRGGLAYSAHVGDSRLYLLRANEIFLMTEDHSAVMDLVRRGLISRDDARHHPDKNIISRALGSRGDVDVTGWPRPFAVLPGDRFLLCTDGLYDLVNDDVLLATARAVHPQVACDRLVTLAREAGGHDNISVAILAMSGGDHHTVPGPKATRAVEIPQ